MTTERFERALKDLKDLLARGKLAQDTTMKKVLETEQAMMREVCRIGIDDGMSKDEIKSILCECYVKSAAQAVKDLDNLTLHDELYSLLYGLTPDKQGRIDNEQITADFPHDKEFASLLLVKIQEKFDACTEEERRKITRSDAEFIYLVGTAIALRCGFKDIREAFGIDESKLQIPKKRRGKELFWSAIGDPDPILSPEDQAFNSKMHELIREIVIKFRELYPELHAKIKDHYTTGSLVLNTSHNDKVDTLHRLSEKSDLKEFKSFAVS
jgi:hypothetical protein